MRGTTKTLNPPFKKTPPKTMKIKSLKQSIPNIIIMKEKHENEKTSFPENVKRKTTKQS